MTRQDLTLKVADFGMARVVDHIYQGHHNTPFPVKWSAPEGNNKKEKGRREKRGRKDQKRNSKRKKKKVCI